MKQILLLTAIFSTAFCFAGNENTGRISGYVMDKELQEPIPYATVFITDTTGNLVTGITSNEDGSFLLDKIEAGEYEFQVQFIGYKTHSQKISIARGNTSLDVGVIALEPDVAMLDDVMVVAERSTIEQRIDRKVINVGKDLTTTGATAAELMNNIPSVNVDQDGNIALRGNSNVRILVDGRPTNMDPAQVLRQIPSTSIKSIELITNPSAKYNPEGMSGIINIVLHKNANNGFNGNLNTGITQGENTRYNASLDANYRTGIINVFGNLGTQQGENFNLGRIYLPEQNLLQAFDLINHRESYIYKIGADLYINDNNTLSVYTNQNHYNGGPQGIFRLIFDDAPDQNFSQLLDLNYSNTNATYNAMYERKFAKEGHKIQMEVNYNEFDQEENSRFDFAGNAGGNIPFADLVQEKRENINANLDYVNPIGETGKLEIGAEARILDTDNFYSTTNPELNNAEYQYHRDIYSLYTTYGQTFEKWSYQLGARAENFTVDAIYNGERVFQDEYFNLYPSGFLNFTPNEKNTYQISYSRRVDRPGFRQVSPIREVNTPRLTIFGNPALDPQFTNSAEFNYTRNIQDKGSITAGVFLRNINDEINQAVYENPDEPGSLIITFENFEDNNAYGLELSTNYKFTKWWSTNSSFEIYSQNLKGVVGTDRLEIDNTAYTLRTSHSFKATKNLTFQAFAFYRGRNQNLQQDMEPMYFMNMGARYAFWDDKATLSLNFNDVFDTQEFEFTNGRPLPAAGRFKGETQTVYLGFSYRFGGGKNAALKRKTRENNESQGGGIF